MEGFVEIFLYKEKFEGKYKNMSEEIKLTCCQKYDDCGTVIDISGVKGARKSCNLKTGVRTSTDTSVTGLYYSKQHKIKSNKGTNQNDVEVGNVKDYNTKKLNAANNKLLKLCLVIFLVCLLLDVFLIKNLVFLIFVTGIEIVIYTEIYANIFKRYRACNKKNIMI